MSISQEKISVVEIYPAIQGEGRYQGSPCVILRLGGCNLRCKWCDTQHSYPVKNKDSIQNILTTIASFGLNTVLITGGEPLLQDNIASLFHELHEKGYTILLETNGSLSITKIPDFVHITMDLKCPSAWEHSDTNNYQNIGLLKSSDEIKFVVHDNQDLEWVERISLEYKLLERFEHAPIIQPVHGEFQPSQIARFILDSKYNFRLGIQLHKYIYPGQDRFV